MRVMVMGVDYTVDCINVNTYELSNKKERIIIRRSPANDGSFFAMNKGCWCGITFKLDNVNNLIIKR
jgi:hypothetical protein